MLSTIPASTIVSVVPSVIGAGGTGLNGTGLILTHNTRVPIGTVQNFGSAAAVSSFFGAADPLAAEAAIYFTGFNGASIQPSSLLMAQFNQTAVAAYLRGGNISGLSLAQLQAISGTLTISVDGYSRPAGRSVSRLPLASQRSDHHPIGAQRSGPAGSVGYWIDRRRLVFVHRLSGRLCDDGHLGGGWLGRHRRYTRRHRRGREYAHYQPTLGVTGGIGTYAVSVPQTLASEAVFETYGVLTVTVVGSGTLAVGQTVSGTGVSASTVITALDGGTGGTGTYYVNNTQTAISAAMTGNATPVVVTYDSVSGAFIITSGITGSASSVAFATGTVLARWG